MSLPYIGPRLYPCYFCFKFDNNVKLFSYGSNFKWAECACGHRGPRARTWDGAVKKWNEEMKAIDGEEVRNERNTDI